MKTIEIVCEACQASERVSQSVVECIAGHAGQLHCKQCGNQIDFDAHAGDVKVLSGGILLELESTTTTSPEPGTDAERSRDSLTPHTFVRDEGENKSSPSGLWAVYHTTLEFHASGKESDLTRQNRLRSPKPPLRRSLPGLPLPPARPFPLRELGMRPAAKPNDSSQVGASVRPLYPIPPSHRRASSSPGIFQPTTSERSSNERSSVTPVTGWIVSTRRIGWAPMAAAVGLGMLVGLAIGTASRMSTLEAHQNAALAPAGVPSQSEAAGLPFQEGPSEAEDMAFDDTAFDEDMAFDVATESPTIEEPLLEELEEKADQERTEKRPKARSSWVAPPAAAASLEPTAENLVPHAADAKEQRTGPEVSAAAEAAASIEGSTREEPLPSAPFNTAGVAGILNGAAAVASNSCRDEGDPNGLAKVTVTFAPSGRVTRALISGPPFAGTSTGSCIARQFRSLEVAPFSGERVTVIKTVTIQ